MTGSHPVGKGVSSLMSIVSNQPISSPVLIGREREQDHLHALIDQVGQGHGQAILLSGEAGVRETSPADRRKREASGARFFLVPEHLKPPSARLPFSFSHPPWFSLPSPPPLGENRETNTSN